MALTQSDIDNIDEAIAAGEKTVEVNGRKVEYRSIDEMLKIRRHITKVIAQQRGIKKRPLSSIHTVVDRGL